MLCERQSTVRIYSAALVFVLVSIICFFAACGFSDEDKKATVPARYMTRALRHISVDKGKSYISELNLGTASQLPKTNMLLITADPHRLVKASGLLMVVDSEKGYVIEKICPASDFNNLPWSEKIASEVGKIVIGTFANPPRQTSSDDKAIIDVHEGSVILIAPADKAKEIISIIKKLEKAETTLSGKAKLRPTEIEPNAVVEESEPKKTIELEGEEAKELELLKFSVPAEAEEEQAEEKQAEKNDLFGRLVGAIEEAEKTAAETKEIVPEPNQPEDVNVVESVLEQAEEKKAIVPVTEEKEVVAGEPNEVKMPAPKIEEAEKKVEAEVSEPSRYELEPIELADEMLELDLPEKLEIPELLRLVGEWLKLDYMYDPEKVKGSVTLKLRGPIKVKDLYPLLESVLQFKDFVMTRKGNLVTIVPAAEANRIDPDLRSDGGKIKVGNVLITQVFKLTHIDTATAQNFLTQMELGTNIRAIPETKTLIVTGFAYRMPRVEKLLEMIDQPGKPKIFRYRQLQYTMAASLAPKIKELAEQLGTIQISIEEPEPVAKKPTPKRGRKAPAKKAAEPPAKAVEATVYLDADERTNRILMIGLEEQLVVVDDLIDSLDVKQQDLRALRLYQIQFVGAEEVREKLEELGIVTSARETAAPSRARTRPQPQRGAKKPTAAQQAAATETQEAPVEEPQVVIIEATNSLLVNATAEQHARIATIIGYVDSEPEQASIKYVVYPLENQDPEELALVLEQLISDTVTEKDQKDTKIQRTTKTKKIEDDVIIVPDAKTYSLIVYANKKNQQWISSLIETLDQYRPQVLLDVTLVEITKDDAFTSEIELLTKTYGGRTGALGTLGDSSEFSASRLFDAKSTPSGETEAIKVFLNSSKVQMLLTALEKKGYGRIMARPKILVNDNQEGEITTKNSTSIAQISSSTQVPDTGTPVVSTDVSFKSYDAGITLGIKPHISMGNMLRLEITLNRTDFSFTEGRSVDVQDETYPRPPDLLSTDIKTVATVPDGTTIILGGLEAIKQNKSHSKVPILGDIPLIGGLFRGIDNSDEQSRLYIFVKAHIIRPGDQEGGLKDIRRVSERNRASFEEIEDKFQKLEDWPGIKPTPMDPLRVLEED